MSGKMGHVEQPVILAKLIEIQAGKPVAVDHQMLGSEVPVDWGSSNASKGMVAVLVNRVLGCIVARYIRSGP